MTLIDKLNLVSLGLAIALFVFSLPWEKFCATKPRDPGPFPPQRVGQEGTPIFRMGVILR